MNDNVVLNPGVSVTFDEVGHKTLQQNQRVVWNLRRPLYACGQFHLLLSLGHRLLVWSDIHPQPEDWIRRRKKFQEFILTSFKSALNHSVDS